MSKDSITNLKTGGSDSEESSDLSDDIGEITINPVEPEQTLETELQEIHGTTRPEQLSVRRIVFPRCCNA